MDDRTVAQSPTEERVLSRVCQGLPETVAFLGDLVSLPSTLGNERPAQDIVHRRLIESGLASEMWDIDPTALRNEPSYVPWDVSYKNRPNVTALWPAGASGGHSLILNGHIDVVSAEPVTDWTRDPWTPSVEGDWLYGRGAADMKGGIAAMLLAVQSVREAGVRLRGDVIVQSVIEEECGGNGTLACCLRGIRADAAIITEPFQGYLAHVGMYWFRVRIRGQVAHVGVARPVVNPIEKMCLIMSALRRMQAELNARITDPLFRRLPVPLVLNFGVVQAGDWPSSVPRECTLECRMGAEPGVSQAQAQARIVDAIAQAAQQDPYLRDHPPIVEFFGPHSVASVADPSGPAMKLLGDVHHDVSGGTLEQTSFAGGTDQYCFTERLGMEATCYGPSGEGYHGGDERVSISSLKQVAQVLALFIVRWCGVAD